jgi:methane/ammonia monooxygenase subunit C
MSFITNIIRTRASAAEASAERPLMNLSPMLIATGLICAFYVGVRIYQQFFHRTAGIDSYSGEFELYWVSILYIATIAEVLCFPLLVAYFWKTRDPDIANVEPREEVRRIFSLLGWIFVYGLALYWGSSFFNEQDAPWHEVAYRHAAYANLNILKVFVAIPIYIILGIGAFMYARTRVPTFATKGVSVAFVCFVLGPLMALPAIALVKWGSAAWIAEDLFVAPFNWPRVFFGWFSLGIFGVSLLIIDRLLELAAGYDDLFGKSSASVE